MLYFHFYKLCDSTQGFLVQNYSLQELMGNGGMSNNHLRLGLVDHFGENHSGGIGILPPTTSSPTPQLMLQHFKATLVLLYVG